MTLKKRSGFLTSDLTPEKRYFVKKMNVERFFDDEAEVSSGDSDDDVYQYRYGNDMNPTSLYDSDYEEEDTRGYGAQHLHDNSQY